MAVWIINKYASPPGANGGLRGLSLASEFIEQGHSALLINSRSNHYVIKPESSGAPFSPGFTVAKHWGVTTYTHQTIRYGDTASALRVLSWLHFELGLLTLPVSQLPRPTHIIVSSLSLLTVLNGYRLARKFRARLAFEIRDIWPLTLTVSSSLTQKNPLAKVLSWIEKFGYRHADVVVGTMPNLIEHVQSVAGSGIRVETIGLGIDRELSDISQSAREPRSSPGFNVVYAGSIGRANALHRLLSVAEKFSEADGVTFEFFGKGAYLDEFQKKYASWPSIIFHGALARSKLLETMRTADVVFLATDDSEIWRYGQSLHKVVEYMTLGRPIIAAYSGFPSMIDEADCGVFVPADDEEGLRRRILDFQRMTPAERDAIGARGRDWIFKHRTYAKLAEDYLKILDSL
jgi:glycosyltransferase involved in cell wall biosynthesis